LFSFFFLQDAFQQQLDTSGAAANQNIHNSSTSAAIASTPAVSPEVPNNALSQLAGYGDESS